MSATPSAQVASSACEGVGTAVGTGVGGGVGAGVGVDVGAAEDVAGGVEAIALLAAVGELGLPPASHAARASVNAPTAPATSAPWGSVFTAASVLLGGTSRSAGHGSVTLLFGPTSSKTPCQASGGA